MHTAISQDAKVEFEVSAQASGTARDIKHKRLSYLLRLKVGVVFSLIVLWCGSSRAVTD